MIIVSPDDFISVKYDHLPRYDLISVCGVFSFAQIIFRCWLVVWNIFIVHVCYCDLMDYEWDIPSGND